MTAATAIQATIGQIVRRTGQPLHKVEYVIRSRRIQPMALAGRVRVFSEADVEHIEAELRLIDERKGGSK